MNNSTDDYFEEEQIGIPASLRITIDVTIMIFALFGNGLLVISILKSRALRKRLSSKLILNLAFCDMVTVFVSISSTLVENKLGYSPFGEIGCRTINPISTLGVISVVLTLVMISVERFFSVVCPFRYRILKEKTYWAIGFSHLFSLTCVVPYMCYSTMEDGLCIETWTKSGSLTYSIFLFLIQYAVPLPIMIMLYSYSWHKIKQKNDDMIRNVERHRGRAGALAEDDIAKGASQLVRSYFAARKRSTVVKVFNFVRRTPDYKSQQSIKRHKQTMDLLKMFLLVVAVFAICMLPNQITWLSGLNVSPIWIEFAYWLTYTNSICNPIIYGLNPKFRGAYLRQIYFCLGLCCSRINTRRPRSESIMSTTMSDVYPRRSPNLFKRHEEFNRKTRSSSQDSNESSSLLFDSRDYINSHCDYKRTSSPLVANRRDNKSCYYIPTSSHRISDARQFYQPVRYNRHSPASNDRLQVYLADDVNNDAKFIPDNNELNNNTKIELDDDKTCLEVTPKINVEGVKLGRNSMSVNCCIEGRKVSLVFNKEHLEVLKYLSETDC